MASSTFRVGQQFFKTIARMYSSFSDDSVPFRRSSERDISQSCVGSIVSKKELNLSNHWWLIVFGGDAHSVMWGGRFPHPNRVVMTFHCDIHLRLSSNPSIMGYGSNQCDDISPRIHPEWMRSIVCIMDHRSMTVWCSILMTQTFRYDFSAFIYTEKIAMIWHNFFGFFRWPPPQNFIYHPNT